MKKFLAIIFFNVGILLSLSAAHIKGGELYYEYLGSGNATNSSRYRLTLKLYIDCGANSPGQLDNAVPLTVFRKDNNAQVQVVTASMESEVFLKFDPATNPCIGNPPLDVCYRVRTYSITIELENIAQGYTVGYQRCCRIIDIRNLTAPSNSYGATYFCEIPGTSIIADGYKNSSPKYITNDAAAICKGSAFTFDFGADEADGDSVVYALCSGYIGASQAVPTPTSASPPPYTSLNYQGSYSGLSPLGPSVRINPKTGIVTGVAPTQLGQYVITACASEYREGRLINIHRKDIHIAVSDCIPLKALLQPEYSFCDDFLVTLKNEQINPPGAEYTWEFGDGSAPEKSLQADGAIQHQYADTGTYAIKLRVILAGQCIDSTTTLARVYPGFFPGFAATGSCQFSPFQFRDTSRTRYGTISQWSWSFGDETRDDDSSNIKNPSWLYNSLGLKQVSLTVQSDKGCVGTVSRDIEVRDLPLMSLAFRDTLICSIDSVRLGATGSGGFSWSPGVNIINPNSTNPIVYPKTTTTYIVRLNENGCVNTDSVRVRVVDFVTLNAGADTTICLTDEMQFRPRTDGLQFSWTPSAGMNDATLKEPICIPTGTTTYRIQARIGKCMAEDQIQVRTVPYPFVDAGIDTVLCYQDTALLKGNIVGSSFAWSPTGALRNHHTLSPFAYPEGSTTYRLTAFDTLGCPKPGFDEVVVTVREPIHAFAGNDTTIVVGQPLQLSGTGAELYQWMPPIGLNNASVNGPVAMLDENMTYVMRAYTEEGCFGLDTMNIRVFKSQPDIFVPNAFAPDGRNRILMPVTPGIAVLHYFKVFNRWGQMVFSTTDVGKGWDGKINGKVQDSGTYVWVVSGKDYTGKTISRKGTATLIR
jgi:PKD repeat protein